MTSLLAIQKKGPLFRLKDIQPEEVSIVDRAANRRKFILVKRDQEESMPGRTELSTDGDRLSVSDAQEEVVVKFDMALPPAMKTDLSAKLQDAVERILEMANSVRTAKEEDSGSPSPEFMTESQAVKALLDEVEKLMNPETSQDGPQGDEDKQGTETIGKDENADQGSSSTTTSGSMSETDLRKAASTHAALLKEKIDAIKTLAQEIAEGADSMDLQDLRTKMSTMESMGWRIGDVAEVVNVGKSEGTAETEKTEVSIPAGLTEEELDAIEKGDVEAIQKIGRKMSAVRLSEFKKGIDEVEKILSVFLKLYEDLAPEEKKKTIKRAMEDMGITMDSPTQKTNAGAGSQPDQDVIGNMGDDMGTPGAVSTELSNLRKMVERQDKIIADLKKGNRTIEAPTSARPESSVQVQKGTTEDTGVDWGLDLNDPNYLKRNGLR